MIDRTEFDLRVAAHQTTTVRVNRREWQQQRGGRGRTIRATLASALVALAMRLDAASLVRAGASLSPARPA